MADTAASICAVNREDHIKLSYAPDNWLNDSALSSVFTGAAGASGLRLEPQNVPVDMLMIAHVEKHPDREPEASR